MSWYDSDTPTKTMSDFDDETIFISSMSEVDRQTVRDWFDSRVVCDDDTFPKFFRRICATEYPRYLQLMRIQPGVAGTEYDWMVQDYREAMALSSQKDKQGGMDTHTRTPDLEDTTKTTGGHTVTDGGEDITEETSSRKQTITKSGGHSVEQSGSDGKDLTHGETIEDKFEGGHYLEKIGDETHDIVVDHSTSITGDVIDDYGNKEGALTTEKTTSGAYVDLTRGSDKLKHFQDHKDTTAEHADHKEAQKTAPMSTSGAVTAVTAGDDQVDGMSVDFSSAPSAIGQTNDHSHQTVHREADGEKDYDETRHGVTSGRRYGMHLAGDGSGEIVQDPTVDPFKETEAKYGKKTTTYNKYTQTDGKSDTDTLTYNNRLDHTYYDKETGEKKTQTHSGEDVENYTYGKKETFAYDAAGEREVSEAEGPVTTKVTHGKTQTFSYADDGETVTHKAHGKEAEKTEYGKTMSHYTGAQDQSTGRHEDPAAILERAVTFIESTSAWAWFALRLEPAFYQIYDL